ncbi:universal stress protein [Legionella sp. EUR-108]|uniref:Universal stress protein n=1 Tax=Legionella maioricensis TaxID=2896528 RepID=A0A9X2D1Y6_9GAMM|nr:universal stress protein [Legionella maioricensis]MCL9688240.1 universal stress protein [Legionella maioricensis]
MYKHIMIAVDGSDTSALAMQEAIRMTKDQKATLRIVYIVDESFVHDGEAVIDYDVLWESARKDGQKILNEMEEIARQAKIKFESQLIELKAFQGNIAEKINEATESQPTDLLVIGTHGRRGFNRLLLGSVAENVVRIATKPVLLIRGE